MTPQQYIKQHKRPTGVHLSDVAKHTGKRINDAELIALKKAEVLRRVTPDMEPEQMAEKLGIKPRTLRHTFNRLLHTTLNDFRGVTVNSTPKHKGKDRLPEKLKDLRNLAWYRAGDIISAAELTGILTIQKTEAQRIMDIALERGWVQEVEPGKYQRVSQSSRVMRMQWVKGEASRLRAAELERMKEREADLWAAAR